MADEAPFKIAVDTLTADVFLSLYRAVGWEPPGRDQVKRALSNSLASFTAYAGDTPVGMARLLGDGGMSFYIKDFAVWTSLMTFFTDEIKKEMSLEEQYAVTCNANLREAIMNNCQASYIYDAILEAIDIKVKKEIRKTRLDKIIDTVISVVNTPEMLEKLNGLMDMANEWLDEIETVEKNGEKVKN